MTRKQYLKKWKEKNRDKCRRYNRRWYARNRQRECTRKLKYWNKNKRREARRRIERTKELRHIVLMHYGHKCACKNCNITQNEFLAIDHIKGGGDRHRKQVGSSLGLYAWIIKHKFPKSLRLLCHNCNQSRGYYGYCPHE